MDFSERLVSLRKKNGLSQLELAEKLNVSRQAISRWEVGTSIPTMENWIALSKLYGISVDELICKDDAKKPIEEKESETDTKEGKGWLKRFQFSIIVVGVVLAVGICAAVLIWAVQSQSKLDEDPIGIKNMKYEYVDNWDSEEALQPVE